MDTTNDDGATTLIGSGAFNQFESALLDCVHDVNLLLPGLAERYDMPVVIRALAEHAGAAVQVLVRRQVCDTRRARLLIKHIEGTAFLRKVRGKAAKNKQAPRPVQVGKCAAEIRASLPALVDRHTLLVVVSALTEHLGGALFLSLEAHVFSPAQARAIIRRVEQIAFGDTKSETRTNGRPHSPPR